MSNDDDATDRLSNRFQKSRPGRVSSVRPRTDESLQEVIRRYALPAMAALSSESSEPHPFAPAGPKLKRLREQSGWEVSEIADRTGVKLETLEAFERGDSAAAASLELSDLERLASACCCSVDDLVNAEQISAAKRLPRSRPRSLFDL